ncbi:MAG TPA: MFS transporter [Methylomirabilota bacterium]
MTPAAPALADRSAGVAIVALLCLAIAGGTVSLGAFPALLPEIGRGAALADWELGLLAGMFGFARMVSNIPVGLFLTHHAGAALVLGPLVTVAGLLLLIGADSFPALLAGRALMGLGHTLTMVAGLTTILRRIAGGRLASALNAYELSAMIGILGGVVLVRALPAESSWSAVFVLASTPIAVNLAVVPPLLVWLRAPRGTARAPLFARADALAEAPPDADGRRMGTAAVALASIAGAATAVAYSTIEQFVVPVRGSREFGLDRHGIARLLLVMQACDTVALVPVGALSDRRGVGGVLGVVLIVLGTGVALITFGGLTIAYVGAMLFGLGMAGWMLPLGVLRRETPRAQVAWWTSLYRVGVDGGLFLGPFLSGLLAGTSAGLVPGAVAGVLVAVGVLILRGEARRA